MYYGFYQDIVALEELD